MSSLIILVKVAVRIVLSILVLRYSPIGRYYARIGLYLYCVAAITTGGTLLAATLTSIGRKLEVNYCIGRMLYASTSALLELHLDVEGLENLDENQPVVLMANHQSMFDAAFLGRVIPKRTCILAKHSLQYTPLGLFMNLSGFIFINRSNNTEAVRALASAAQQVKSQNTSVLLFPEGTRRLDSRPDILPLKKGGFHLAVQVGIPIVPVVVENFWRLYRPGVFRKGRLRMRVLPPIPTAGLTAADVPDLMNHVRDEMLKNLFELSTSPSTPTHINTHIKDLD